MVKISDEDIVRKILTLARAETLNSMVAARDDVATTKGITALLSRLSLSKERFDRLRRKMDAGEFDHIRIEHNETVALNRMLDAERHRDADAIRQAVLDARNQQSISAPDRQALLDALRNGQFTGAGLGPVVRQEQPDKTALHERHVQAAREIVGTFRGPLKLSRPQGSGFHHLKQAFRDRSVLVPGIRDIIPKDLAFAYDHAHQIFIMEHDWHAAFASAKDFDGGEVHFPADFCAFEFRINERRVIAATMSKEAHIVSYQTGQKVTEAPPPECDSMMLYVHMPVGWVTLMCANALTGEAYKCEGTGILFDCIKRISKCVAQQIRAALIALDAEVAEHTVVRAPYKMNRKREERGRLPMHDYHVISLARRHHRVQRLDGERAFGEKRRTPRFHFRRGHNRHYENYKVWIRWTLVGDPDLGVINKDYRL